MKCENCSRRTERKFNELFQEIVEANEGQEINLRILKQGYDGGFVEGLEIAERYQNQKFLGLLKRYNKRGSISHFLYRELKGEIERK